MHFIRKLLIAVAAVTVAPMTGSAAQLACNSFTFSKIATITGVQTTSSTTAVNVAGATIEAQVDSGCSMVEFSAQVRAKAPKIVRISVTADNGMVVRTALPSSVDFSTSVNGYDGRAVAFVFPNLDNCLCTFQVKFLSADGTPVSISKGVMKLRYYAE